MELLQQRVAQLTLLLRVFHRYASIIVTIAVATIIINNIISSSSSGSGSVIITILIEESWRDRRSRRDSDSERRG